jgi:hypothetical protein
VVGAAVLVLGGCGKDDSKDAVSDTLDRSTPGAHNFLGRFANVPNAPEGEAPITGIAEMTVADGRTRVDVLVAGLNAKSTYIAHVHDDVCSAADPGGAHFKFKADGESKPPNEIHLPITLAPDLTGTPKTEGTKGGNGDVTVDGEAGPEARSVVLHVLRRPGATADEAKPPKLACADLKPDDGNAIIDTATPSANPTKAPKPKKSAAPKKSAEPKKSGAPKESASPEPSPDSSGEPGASPEPSG